MAMATIYVQTVVDRNGEATVLHGETPAMLQGALESYIIDVWDDVFEDLYLPGSYSPGGRLLELDVGLAQDQLEDCGFQFYDDHPISVNMVFLQKDALPLPEPPKVELKTYSIVVGTTVEAYWETTFKAVDAEDAIQQARKYAGAPDASGFGPSWDTASDRRIVELLDAEGNYLLEDDRSFKVRRD